MIEELSYSLHIGNDKNKTSKAKQISKERPTNFNNNAIQNGIQLSKVESWKQRVNEIVDFISERVKGFFGNILKSKYKDVAEDLYSKKIIEEDTFEELQDTYEFSKNQDYERDKDDFEIEI